MIVVCLFRSTTPWHWTSTRNNLRWWITLNLSKTWNMFYGEKKKEILFPKKDVEYSFTFRNFPPLSVLSWNFNFFLSQEKEKDFFCGKKKKEIEVSVKSEGNLYKTKMRWREKERGCLWEGTFWLRGESVWRAVVKLRGEIHAFVFEKLRCLLAQLKSACFYQYKSQLF